jgi:hypothetical protein
MQDRNTLQNPRGNLQCRPSAQHKAQHLTLDSPLSSKLGQLSAPMLDPS